MVYLQVTRGAADRDFAYPAEPGPEPRRSSPRRGRSSTPPSARDGIRVIAVPDIRWARRDIKTVQLLAPSMCKMMAKKAGKDDAWLVEDGFVTEGTSNNAWIVTRDGVVVTRDLSSAILHGITRAAVLAYAREAQIRVEERPFTLAEAQRRGRGLHHRRLGLRDPGGRDRRHARRRRPARPGDPAPARALPRREPAPTPPDRSTPRRLCRRVRAAIARRRCEARQLRSGEHLLPDVFRALRGQVRAVGEISRPLGVNTGQDQSLHSSA